MGRCYEERCSTGFTEGNTQYLMFNPRARLRSHDLAESIYTNSSRMFLTFCIPHTLPAAKMPHGKAGKALVIWQQKQKHVREDLLKRFQGKAALILIIFGPCDNWTKVQYTNRMCCSWVSVHLKTIRQTMIYETVFDYILTCLSCPSPFLLFIYYTACQ